MVLKEYICQEICLECRVEEVVCKRAQAHNNSLGINTNKDIERQQTFQVLLILICISKQIVYSPPTISALYCMHG